jgi:class 3 adenylate cyclase/tetratricopeptide (TPR) repeat protein
VGFRFCGNCGAPLPDTAVGREVRKVVTVVFCDLTGSTALGDGADPETIRATMRGYYEQMRSILERHGGTVEKFIGDAVMAVFGVPIAHEDDALRAVRAAWEMKAAVPRLGLRARIGVNTGEVMAGEGDTLVSGDAVNVAARLEQAAEAGEVLLGAGTRRLVRGAVRTEPVEIAARGKPDPLPAFRLVDLDPEAASVARRLDTPLVGRRSELDQLVAAFERTVRERRCHLFTVLGAAGVGKSRLVAEFLDGRDAIVLQGRCLDYGKGITFWPVISILKQLGERARGTLARLVEGASTPNELFWLVRGQLEEVALERPLVVCFDDIHWGEDTFLDLIDHIADLSRGAPIFVVCLARPELLEKRPTWGGGKLNATTLLLESLTPEECIELMAEHGGVEPETRDRILEAADGNPLFVEEMVAFAREEGDIRVPGTVQALLQARLDQLDRDERSVVDHGAVEGQVFHRSALIELTRMADLEPQLLGLVRKELIHPTVATFADDRAFRFRHLLIRDAAYDALPKETRAELHERFATWLQRNGQELIEFDEVLGFHLEQAALYLRQLGRPNPELERRAGRALGAAGSSAAARTDAPGSLNLFRRALALLPAGDERRAETLLDQLLMLESAGLVDEQLRVIDELEASSDEAQRMHGRIARLSFRLQSDPEQVLREAERSVAEALPVFAAAHDDLGAAHAYQLLAFASWTLSRAVPTAAALDQLVEHARRIEAAGLVDRAILMIMGPLRYGPFSADEIRARLAIIREWGSVTAQHCLLTVGAHLAYRAGELDEALELGRQAGTIGEDLGLPLMHIFARWEDAHVLLTAGRLADARVTYKWVIERFGTLGHTSFRSTALLGLAQVVYQQGDRDETERLIAEAHAIGASEDIINYAWGQGLRARMAADRGDLAEAEQLARQALEYAHRTDFPGVHAAAHEALAHALHAAGRWDEARSENQQALELWEHYGYTCESSRVRSLLAKPGGLPDAEA